ALPFTTRPRELKDVVGFFANAVPLRAAVDERLRFDELLATLNQRLREASEHTEFPLGGVLEDLDRGREGGHAVLPICVTQLCSLEMERAGLRFETCVPSTSGCGFDLDVGLLDERIGITIAIAYSTDL